MAQPWSRRGVLALCAVLMGLPLALLSPFLDAGFVADDLYFAHTPFSLSPRRLVTGEEWRHNIAADVRAYRPLVTASYAIDQAIAADRPLVYRITNLALHGAVSVLVALLASALARSSRAGWIAGILFAVHPVHHENILWISGRTFPLAALFYVTALWLVAAAPKNYSTARRDIVGALLCLGALGSYEATVTLPLAVTIVGVLAANDVGRSAWARALRTAMPYAAAVAAYLAIRWIAISDVGAEGAAFGLGRLWHNLLSVAGRLLAIPRNGHSPVFVSVTLWVSAALAVLTLWHALVSRPSRRVAIGGLFLCAVAYLPFVALAGYADRFAYLASLGFILAIAVGAERAMARNGWAARLMTIVLAATVVLWSRQLVRAGEQWQEAGRIVESFSGQLRTFKGELPFAAKVTFFCVPDFHGTAYVYYTYFAEEMQRATGRPDLKVTRMADPSLLTVRDAVKAAESGQVFAFRWSERARRLELLSKNGYLEPTSNADAQLCEPGPQVTKP